MILVIQLSKEKDSVEILFDKEGLSLLRSTLSKEWKNPIIKGDDSYDFDHEHLLSKEWGGNELTPEFSSPEVHKIQEVKIIYVGDDGKEFLSD